MAISRSLKDGGYKGAMGLFHEVDEQRTAENQRELLALKCHSVNQNITELSGKSAESPDLQMAVLLPGSDYFR